MAETKPSTTTTTTTTVPGGYDAFDPSAPATSNGDGTVTVSGDTTPADLYSADYQGWVPFQDRPEFQDVFNGDTFDPGNNAHQLNVDSTAIHNRVSDLMMAMKMMRTNASNGAGVIQSELGAQVYDDLVGQYISPLSSNLQANGGYEEFGYKFNAGALPNWATGFDPYQAGPPASAQARPQGPLNEFNGMSLHEIRAAYYRLNPNDQANIKGLLWQAGYYDSTGQDGKRKTGTPLWDNPDLRDEEVFFQFLDDNMADPHRSMNQVLDQKIASNYERRLGDYLGTANGGRGPGGGATKAGHVYRRSDPNTLRDSLDKLAQTELGMGLDSGVMENIVAEALQKEHSSQAANFAAQDAADGSSSNSITPSGASLSDIDAFLAAVGQDNESGKVEFSPAEWSTWAKYTGFDPRDGRTPDNQQEVARRLADMYIGDFGNWRDAASAWYTGPASQTSLNDGPSVSDYSRDILKRMVNTEKTFFGDGGGGGRGPDVTVQTYDMASDLRRQLLAKNATDVQTWKYAKRGSEFFDLLSRGSSI